MQLPKIVTPQYTMTLPITKKEIKYRPFLVKEEKILLTAIEGYDGKKREDSLQLIDTVFQIVGSCVLTEGVDVRELPSVDIEMLFLNIRKKSIAPEVDLIIQHKANGCNHYNTVKVDLEKSYVHYPENHNHIIKLDDTSGIVLKYPSLKRTFDITTDDNKSKAFYNVLIEAIDTIYVGDDHAKVTEYKREELEAWFETLPKKVLAEIYAFFDTLPYVRTDIEYTCEKCGAHETMEVKGTTNFFT